MGAKLPNPKPSFLLTPGPGTNDINDRATKNKSATWKFGSEKRPDLAPKHLSLSPGPGNYQLPSKMIEGPKTAMHTRNNM
jgi:hypothetical protein